MSTSELMLWIAFHLIVAVMLFIDLGIANRHAHVISIREAAIWSAIWILLSLLFNTGIYYFMGGQKGLEFLTGYLIEKSLSVDNMFVFLMIFAFFNVPPLYQPRVLKWGILGALVMRLILILTGAALLKTFHWVIYLFGALLVFTGIKMVMEKERKIEPEKNLVLRFFKRFIPVKEEYDGERFFIRNNGILHATPLFATLLVVEASDLVFAIDSIPAIFAITTDTFIVYTSNVFAILGLRALYFLLNGIMGLFRYLKEGISIILIFVGVKMIIIDFYKIPISVSLGVVGGSINLVSFHFGILDISGKAGADARRDKIGFI